MYIIVREISDEVTGTHTTCIATCDSKQIADDICTLAELEMEEAKKIPRPKYGINYNENEESEYWRRIDKILTIEKERSPLGRNSIQTADYVDENCQYCVVSVPHYTLAPE